MYEPQGTARAYRKELSSLYVNSLASYGQYERLARYADYSEMEYCILGSTLIAVPGGYKTIKELAEEYGLEKEFVVFSYDHEVGQIVPAIAKQARKTRTEHAWKVTFDNGKEIIGTSDHRLMLRDGSYRKICGLVAGDSMMPFYRRSFRSPKGRFDTEHYQYIYSMTPDTKNGWQTEHKMIAEWSSDRIMEENEVVHHKNFLKFDNRPENLEIMNRDDHSRLHRIIYNKEHKWNYEKNSEWIEKFKREHSKFMKENNPAERRDITFAKILQAAENNGFNLYETCKVFDTDPNVIKRKLKRYSFANWEIFAKTYNSEWKNHGWDNAGSKNPRWDDSLTFQMICDAWTPNMKGMDLVRKLDVTPMKIKGRVKQHGYKSTADFCRNYNNCKVVSVEYYGHEDVYDLTVDKYKNFATDSVISHNTPEIASALNIYADEVTNVDEKGHMIEIESDNQQIKNILETLFFDILNIEFNLHSWVRNLCKYGDFILFVDASEQNGILNMLPIPINEVEREEGYDPKNPFAFRFRWLTQGNMILEAWQIIHFRLLGNDNFLPYGASIIEPARRIWRQLILIEDAMLVYRIVRSPERRVFKIEVGNVKPEDVPAEMEQIQNRLKRSKIIDAATGRVDLRYNPLSVDEDYFLPQRDGKGSDITTLPGGQFTGDIEDVEYIQNKLFAALQIPKAYLGYEGDVGSKATLAQEDVRFSRTIQRIQKIVLSELMKIAIIHLYLLGFRDNELIDYDIKMANPSTIAEQQKLELWRLKLEIAGSVQEGMVSKTQTWRDILGMSKQEIEEMQDEMRADKLFQMELDGITAEPETDEEEPSIGAAPGAEPEPGGEAIPGEEELPTSLGGEEELEAGVDYDDQNDDELTLSMAPILLKDEDECEEDKSEIDESGEGDERHNPGSRGCSSEVSVNKGKDLFDPSEDLFNHVFGTEKQTASDPFDMRSIKRMISNPFSENVTESNEPDPIGQYVQSSLARVEKFENDLRKTNSILKENLYRGYSTKNSS